MKHRPDDPDHRFDTRHATLVSVPGMVHVVDDEAALRTLAARYPRYLGTADCAHLLGMTPAQLRSLADRHAWEFGALPSPVDDTGTLWAASSVRRWLANHDPVIDGDAEIARRPRLDVAFGPVIPGDGAGLRWLGDAEHVVDCEIVRKMVAAFCVAAHERTAPGEVRVRDLPGVLVVSA